MLMNSNEYLQIIETIKGQIKGAQYQAALNVNRELIMLYYHIGKVINEHKTWGSKFIENLAADIRISFPNVKGYSVRNLKYMAKFAETYPDEVFVQTVSAQIPWSHNTVILDKVKDADQRVWYIQKTTENGWSHNVLIHQIESGLYERQVLAGKIANFENRLASPQSELAFHAVRLGFFIAHDDCAVIEGSNDLHHCVFAAPADRTLPMAQIIDDSCFNGCLAGKDHQGTQTVHVLTLGGVKVFALHPAERITEVTAVFDQRDVLSFEDVRCERSATVDTVVNLTVIGFFCGNPIFLSDLTI